MRSGIGCAECAERMTDYLEDSLAPATADAMEVHLRSCAGCATMLAELRRMAELLATLPPDPPTEAERRRLTAQFREWTLRH
jgi:anti-sigma factor RsiW